MKKLITILIITNFTILISCNNKPSNRNVNKEITPELLEFDSISKIQLAGDLDESMLRIEKFVVKYPNTDYGYQLQAIIYLALNKDSLAEIAIKKALTINPNNYGALANYGVLLDRYEKYPEAEIYYKKSILLKPSFPQTYSNLAGNQLNQNKYNEAKYYCEKAIQLANKNCDIGVLCLIYDKLEMRKERDSVLFILKQRNYINLEKLNEVISK